MKHRLTIQDAIRITGKSKTTIYRYIKSGKLKSEIVKLHGTPVYFIDLKDLEEFLGYKVGEHGTVKKQSHGTVEEHGENMGERGTPLNEETLVNAIDKYFKTKQTELVKPMEQQALYLVGELKNEVKHLQAEKDTLRQENELLREQVKALPDKSYIEKMQKENQEKEKYLMIQIELERQEKADLLSRGETIRKEQEEKHRKELEARQEEQDELHRQELDKVKTQAEEREKAVIDECKRQLQDYINRPWYRKLFS